MILIVSMMKVVRMGTLVPCDRPSQQSKITMSIQSLMWIGTHRFWTSCVCVGAALTQLQPQCWAHFLLCLACHFGRPQQPQSLVCSSARLFWHRCRSLVPSTELTMQSLRAHTSALSA